MRIDIENGHGDSIDCELTEGRQDGGCIVVIGHGVTSEKDRPYLVALADALAAAGISSLRF